LHHACAIDSQTKLPLIDPESFEKNTSKAKKILESVSGARVVGYRAPNALIAGWMLDSLRRLNFCYDSSVCVNSLYNKSDAVLQTVSSYPYHPGAGVLESGGSEPFLEFPWPYWDLFGLKIPTTGGPMLRFLGSHVVLKWLEQSLRRGTTIFYFHPIDISDEKFPRIGKNRPFYWAIKGAVIEKRIERIIRVLKSQDVVTKPIRDLLE
jgi:peptidoglycan/xylan/chitin deacetylase (PgdA/CDA1 family)